MEKSRSDDSVETLHQTFELIKTIVDRIAKHTPDASRAPELEATLMEIDKFSRRASKAYKSRLSDAALSELSDMLTPFNLDVGDEEVQYVKSVQKSVEPSPSATSSKPRESTPSSTSSTPIPTSKPSAAPAKAVPKDAFKEMMRRAGAPTGSSRAPEKASTPPLTKPTKPKPADDDFGDDVFEGMSAADLDIIEKRAKIASTKPSLPLPPLRKPPTGQQTLSFATSSGAKPRPSSEQLKINVVPKPPPPAPKPAGSSFKSQLMRDLRNEHREAQLQRNIGGLVPKIPAPSGLGSGLGAYQGPRRPVAPVDSGSSASESSDEDSKGLNALTARQKVPKKTARMPIPERRPIKILGSDLSDIMSERENVRAAQHRLRMRLRPDLTPLHRFVLAWNPDHAGDDVPHAPQTAKDIASMGPVPTAFPGCDKYRQVMLPLFLQELWMQCRKDAPTMLPLTVELVSRSYEDDFIDMDMTVLGQLPPMFNLNDTDIVVLRDPTGKSQRRVLAKVIGLRRKPKDSALKVRILRFADQRNLVVKAKWDLLPYVS